MRYLVGIALLLLLILGHIQGMIAWTDIHPTYPWWAFYEYATREEWGLYIFSLFGGLAGVSVAGVLIAWFILSRKD